MCDAQAENIGLEVWFLPTLDAEACFCARAGFGRFQVVLLLYCGCAWAADAMEMMLLSFLGPAVRCEWGLTPSQEGLITSVVFLVRPRLVLIFLHAPSEYGPV